jgi:hypothetical protein
MIIQRENKVDQMLLDLWMKILEALDKVQSEPRVRIGVQMIDGRTHLAGSPGSLKYDEEGRAQIIRKIEMG